MSRQILTTEIKRKQWLTVRSIQSELGILRVRRLT